MFIFWTLDPPNYDLHCLAHKYVFIELHAPHCCAKKERRLVTLVFNYIYICIYIRICCIALATNSTINATTINNNNNNSNNIDGNNNHNLDLQLHITEQTEKTVNSNQNI